MRRRILYAVSVLMILTALLFSLGRVFQTMQRDLMQNQWTYFSLDVYQEHTAEFTFLNLPYSLDLDITRSYFPFSKQNRMSLAGGSMGAMTFFSSFLGDAAVIPPKNS